MATRLKGAALTGFVPGPTADNSSIAAINAARAMAGSPSDISGENWQREAPAPPDYARSAEAFPTLATTGLWGVQRGGTAPAGTL